jgi:polyisoprenoid-binding protein YceI
VIRFDTERGVAVGEIFVDATRTETGNEKRDKKLHGKVLESEKYPLFVFRAARFEGTLPEEGEGTLRLIGLLVLQEVEHPMTLDVTARTHEGHVEATTTFEVPYVDWGLEDPSFFVLRVAKVVDVSLSVRGSLTPNAAETPTGGAH